MYQNLSKVFLSQTIFFILTTFLTLNAFLEMYQENILTNLSGLFDSNVFIFFLDLRLFPLDTLSFSLLNVYLYPFIYVFLLITALSIIFCLTYNKDELLNFMIYCQLILFAGYILFFTESLIIFFFAYEMLLIPSFFILYKFAKTRRCIEAAYLMFFWTQFGALFLIFGFLYLFFIAGSSNFETISNTYFSSFEVNFLFLCFVIGFGVKLPI